MSARAPGALLGLALAGCVEARGAPRLKAPATEAGRSADGGVAWLPRLRGGPALQAAALELAEAELRRPLPAPGEALRSDAWATLGDACSALVNLHRLSGEERYRAGARRIADHLLAWNEYLIAHRDPAVPYLGWGPRERKGYFGCATVPDFHADDLWDTAGALRCLLKVSEVAGGPPAATRYYQRARDIALRWPSVEIAPGKARAGAEAWQGALRADGPYARAGLRSYRKSSLPCERRHVKNTNLAMGEQLLRIYLLAPKDPAAEPALRAAQQAIGAELWDVLAHRNLAYASYLSYLDASDPSRAEQAAHNDRKVVARVPGQPGAGLGCGERDASCWNHLGFEGYALGQIGGLLLGVADRQLLVPSLRRDVDAARAAIMSAFLASPFGDAARFDWAAAEGGGASATHVTAYACALRLLPEPAYGQQCEQALSHRIRGATALYGLVPDALVR